MNGAIAARCVVHLSFIAFLAHLYDEDTLRTPTTIMPGKPTTTGEHKS